MADYTFHSLVEPIKNNSTIQTILDVDALAAPAKAALAAYVSSLGLPSAETQHLTWENVGVAVLVRSLALTYYLPSLGTQTPAADVKRTSTLRDRVTEMQKLQSAYPKCQMLIYGKTSPSDNWIWLNTEVIQNSGNQVNTLKLLPYINQMEDFAPGRGCAIGIQFIADTATNATLPQTGDRITAQGSVFVDVNPIAGDSKKNDDVGQLRLELATLQLALDGRLTNLSASTLLGRTSGTGVVEQVPMSTFATPAQVSAAIASLLGGATQATLDTIGEIGAALGNDANFAATITTALAGKAPLNSPSFTGFIALGDNVAIKKKLITGITAATQGGTVSVAHGITSTKIINITGVVFYATNNTIALNGRQINYSTMIATDTTYVNVTNESASSAEILSKPFFAVIEYVQ
ncbi:hypothetical protein IQ269_19225 [Tychonema sp. LEGE 07199]|uniref:hypothetical protein n=1 Tax=unclassified Tychonema TaxID=2642144 RepID=UPI001882CA18|nr:MULTISPECIES: hypothetical protein [unclassified Tychonema]MBE9122870.1 hypothetical protein [Tychonema sp. LEGE 07199]MBE9134725.1 hypothetical protein [Tychonema sp. LEGE 07196]